VIGLQDCTADDARDLSLDGTAAKLFVSLVQHALSRTDVPQLSKFMCDMEEAAYIRVLLSALSDMELSDAASGDSKNDTVIMGGSSTNTSCVTSERSEDSEDAGDPQSSPERRMRDPDEPDHHVRWSMPTTSTSGQNSAHTGRRLSPPRRPPALATDDAVGAVGSASEAEEDSLWPVKVIAHLDRRASSQDFHPSTPTYLKHDLLHDSSEFSTPDCAATEPPNVPRSPVALTLNFNAEAMEGSNLVSIGLVHSGSDTTTSTAEPEPIDELAPWRRSLSENLYREMDPGAVCATGCDTESSVVPEDAQPEDAQPEAGVKASAVSGTVVYPASHCSTSVEERAHVERVLPRCVRGTEMTWRRASSAALVEPDDDAKASIDIDLHDVECGWDYQPARTTRCDDEMQRPEYASSPHLGFGPTPCTSVDGSNRSTPCHTPRELRCQPVGLMRNWTRKSRTAG
jgi:hypothetical protein